MNHKSTASRFLPLFVSLLLTAFIQSEGLANRARAQQSDAEPTPAPEMTVEFATLVQQSRINVREAPSTSAAIIGTLDAGERAQIMGRSAAGNWLNIRMPNSGEGWIYAPLVETEVVARSPALETILDGVASNAEWLPLVQEFDGVAMVLVPAGCFMMGSEEGYENERPVRKVCIREAFWIDRYEVSNEQFEAFGGSAELVSNNSAPNFPREQIAWSEARDFCALRGARLPTEAEWEFAARGPDGLIYPWGNTFVSDNVVYGENSGGETAPVASRPGGVSWVGAYNMVGNVWEWTSSLYRPYPYNPVDGRERADTPEGDPRRVHRGGSVHYGADGLRATFRGSSNPSTTTGFRCARAYS